MSRAAVAAGGRVALVVALGLALAALGGCGDADDDEPAAPPTASTPAPPPTTSTPAGAIELSIRYDDGAGQRDTATLTCGAGAGAPRAGGFLDGKAPAGELCAKARSLRSLLTTQPDKERVCTQIYGGPETARVTGTLDGEKVDRRFTRTNGCELAEFDEASALLQP